MILAADRQRSEYAVIRQSRRKLNFQMVFLSKLENAFAAPSRGCLIVPVALTNADVRAKPGDTIQLRSSKGCVEARISAIERLVRNSPGCQFGFLLSGDLNCSAIPADAEMDRANPIVSGCAVTRPERPSKDDPQIFRALRTA